mmetsp:Transcript_12473/g.31589  ORF Transcript_12473/g.31589 Transcript_12473/m.31589 type:complete len:215 (-) Transcript_12473:672-1316(-)
MTLATRATTSPGRAGASMMRVQVTMPPWRNAGAGPQEARRQDVTPYCLASSLLASAGATTLPASPPASALPAAAGAPSLPASAAGAPSAARLGRSSSPSISDTISSFCAWIVSPIPSSSSRLCDSRSTGYTCSLRKCSRPSRVSVSASSASVIISRMLGSGSSVPGRGDASEAVTAARRGAAILARSSASMSALHGISRAQMGGSRFSCLQIGM